MSLVSLVKSMAGISLPEPFIRPKPSALKEDFSAMLQPRGVMDLLIPLSSSRAFIEPYRIMLSDSIATVYGSLQDQTTMDDGCWIRDDRKIKAHNYLLEWANEKILITYTWDLYEVYSSPFSHEPLCTFTGGFSVYQGKIEIEKAKEFLSRISPHFLLWMDSEKTKPEFRVYHGRILDANRFGFREPISSSATLLKSIGWRPQEGCVATHITIPGFEMGGTSTGTSRGKATAFTCAATTGAYQ